jgi:CubicO group peptidase (beta-lactamase class C family)
MADQRNMELKGLFWRRLQANLIGVCIILMSLAACTPKPIWISYDRMAEGVYPGEHWQKVESPEQLGWCSGKLALARDYSKKIGSAAVMIVDDGVVVDAWGDITREYKCHSMRKSLLSGLIGVHVEEGRIDLSKTMEQLGIDDYEPSLTPEEKQATVGDLIKARSGIYHPALGEASRMSALRPKRHSHSPGTFWYYNNWDFNALGTIFEQETGTKIFEEFERRFANPLQMEDFKVSDCYYKTSADYDSAPWSMHRYYFFRMSTRDLARFGLLFLREGRWHDQRIVSADWVQESTAGHSRTGLDSGYGYMWWTGVNGGLFPNVRIREHSYYASGYGGHRVIVLPYRKLVVVHRVNTDGPGRYPDNRKIGRLLWLILSAAGDTDTGENPSLEKAKGMHLGEEELKEMFEGARVRLQGITDRSLVEDQGGKIFLMTCYPDGSMTQAVAGKLFDTGKWWSQGNRFCVKGKKLTRGRSFCVSLVLDGSTLKVFDRDGTRFDELQFSKD